MSIDYLIIGQGLAGSLLAWELNRRGQRVHIVDNGAINASQVAAGLVNPVTGLRLVKSAHVETLLPFARQHYQQLAQQFGQTFYIEKPMWRLLRQPQALKSAQRRLQQADYQPYLQPIEAADNRFNAPFGLLPQQQTGYLRTQPLLAALKTFFSAGNAYQQAAFDTATLNPEQPHWQHAPVRQLIFCEGYLGQHNPWFGDLPFQPVKGEILTARTTAALPEHILNDGHWLIPLESQQFKTGATFDTVNLDTTPTAAARDILLNALHNLCLALAPLHILNQQAGVRPTTLDKQPFIGRHPQYPQLHIFNGFGAKGSLQIPWYAGRFADYLIHQQPLPPDCDIARYYDTHFPR